MTASRSAARPAPPVDPVRLVRRAAAEALAESGGSPAAAQRALLARAASEPRLLLALVRPYLAAIAARAVAAAAGGAGLRHDVTPPRAAAPPPRPAPRAAPAPGRRPARRLTEPDLEAALAAMAPTLPRVAPDERRSRSDGHARTIRALARAHAERRLDERAGVRRDPATQGQRPGTAKAPQPNGKGKRSPSA